MIMKKLMMKIIIIIIIIIIMNKSTVFHGSQKLTSAMKLTLLPRGWFYNFLRVKRKLLLNCHGEGRMFLLDRKLLVTIFVSLGVQ